MTKDQYGRVVVSQEHYEHARKTANEFHTRALAEARERVGVMITTRDMCPCGQSTGTLKTPLCKSVAMLTY